MKNKHKDQNSGETALIEEVLLANVNDTVQLSYITSMLEDAQIPYRVIAKDLGDYLQIIAGASFMGSCIYVNSSDLDEAQDILKSYESDFTSDN